MGGSPLRRGGSFRSANALALAAATHSNEKIDEAATPVQQRAARPLPIEDRSPFMGRIILIPGPLSSSPPPGAQARIRGASPRRR